MSFPYLKEIGVALLLAVLVPAAALAQNSAVSAQKVYDLLAAGKPQEALDTLNALGRQGPLPWSMQAQKTYILLQLNQPEAAAAWLKTIKPDPAQADEYALLQACVAERLHQYDAAYAGYHALENSRDPEVARQARDQLQYLPATSRLDQWAWGSLDAYGTYYGRYGLVAGQTELREGTYIPGARWIQPFAAFTFLGDTRSSSSGGPAGLSQLYSQNLLGLGGGIVARPFADTDVNFYVEGGDDKDLIKSIQHHGNWFAAIQAGVNGYAAWGPGAVLRNASGIQFNWDWFTDFGGDFSYYSRVPDSIGYLQAQQGLRVIQFGSLGAFDAYVDENGTFDTRGSYFENYGEVGPGARFIFQPTPGMTTSLDAGYYNGAYMGRDDMHDRGKEAASYDDVRVTASLSLHW